MTDEPITLTDDDRQAWKDFYDNGESETFRDPKVDDKGFDGWADRVLIHAMRRVIERDRARIATLTKAGVE